MLVTEEEAKTKRCQESFGDINVTPGGDIVAAAFLGVGLTVGGAGALHTSPAHCIGSACMAWRWREAARREAWEAKAVHPDDYAAYRRMGWEDDPNHKGGLRKKMNNAAPARGFCGKAGFFD